MPVPPFNPDEYFRHAWDAVQIERPVEYSLFTFGESELPYFLVVDSEEPSEPVSLTEGEVRITRPTIVTPGNARPEFRNFFEDSSFDGMAEFLLARSAAFGHLKLDNLQRPKELISDSVEEVVAKLSRRLDNQEEDRVAILSAPFGLGGVALLKYAADRNLAECSGQYPGTSRTRVSA